MGSVLQVTQSGMLHEEKKSLSNWERLVMDYNPNPLKSKVGTSS